MISKMWVGGERRKRRRYNLAFPVRLRPRNRTRTAPPIETATKNISAHGIYVLLSERPELGLELDMEIALPVKLEPTKSVKLRCRAKVARVDSRNAEGMHGVGAVIQDYEFFHEAKMANQNGFRVSASEDVPADAALSLVK